MKILSKRANSFLNDPRYQKKTNGEQSWSMTLEKSKNNFVADDKILTLSYRQDIKEPGDFLFYETIARLVDQKKAGVLFGLSYREIDSYLRDENHLAPFLPEDQTSAEKTFDKIKKELIQLILLERLKEHSAHRFLLSKPWSSCSLLEKNRALLALIEEINALFPKDNGLKLALAEETQIAIVKGNFPLELDIIEAVIKGVLQLDMLTSPLKVVAVQ